MKRPFRKPFPSNPTIDNLSGNVPKSAALANLVDGMRATCPSHYSFLRLSIVSMVGTPSFYIASLLLMCHRPPWSKRTFNTLLTKLCQVLSNSLLSLSRRTHPSLPNNNTVETQTINMRALVCRFMRLLFQTWRSMPKVASAAATLFFTSSAIPMDSEMLKTPPT